jgi:hypothetical protein
MIPPLLDIVFQYGVFPGASSDFVTSLIISILGAFIGFIGAYLIYGLSLKKQRTDTLKYFTALLESTISLAKAQSENITKLSQKLAHDPTNISLLPVPASYDIKRLADKMDQQAVYHAYLKKYERTKSSYKLFKEIYSYVDFIDMTIDEAKRFVEKEYDSIFRRKIDYAQLFTTAKENMELITINQEIIQAHPQFVNGLVAIHNNYHENLPEGENLPLTFMNFIQPLKVYMIQHAPVIEANTTLMLSLKRAADSYLGVQQSGVSFSEQLKDFDGTLMDKATKLNETILELKKNFSIA